MAIKSETRKAFVPGKPTSFGLKKKWTELTNAEFAERVNGELAKAAAKNLRRRKARRRVRILLAQIKSYEEKLEKKRRELSKLYYDPKIFTYLEKEKMALGTAVQDALRGK